jgi:FixJ family two-component response regulator
MAKLRSIHNSIAIVDDDASLLTSLARNLRIAGFEVRTFGSAEEYLACDAVAVADVLLADLRLPGIGGIELSVELQRRGVPMAVVFMTGHSEQETARELDSIGCPMCLRKPFDSTKLRAAIKSALLRVASEPMRSPRTARE